MKELKKALREVDGGRVLDLATRHGEFAEKLRDSLRSYREIIAVDASPAAVEEAKAKLPDLDFRCMDGAALDFPDAHFDLVALSNSLHHLEKPDAVLAEMQRVLKPGGLFILNEMFCDDQSPAQQCHVLLHHLGGAIDTLLGEYHGPTQSRAALMTRFEQLGLQDSRVFTDFESDPALRAQLEKKISKLDAKVKKTEHSPRHADFVRAALEIHEHFAQHGIERCTQLVLMGRKA